VATLGELAPHACSLANSGLRIAGRVRSDVHRTESIRPEPSRPERMCPARAPSMPVWVRDLRGLALPGGEDWLISGTLADRHGSAGIRFARNEVVVPRGVWDFTMEGRILTVRLQKREIAVRLEVDGQGNQLFLHQFEMRLEEGTARTRVATTARDILPGST
jgi:hypothetical protein